MTYRVEHPHAGWHREIIDQAETHAAQHSAQATAPLPVNVSGGLDPTQMIPTEGMPETADLDWERRIDGRRALQADYEGGRLDAVTATLRNRHGVAADGP